ncbi:MAG: hypothetical protein R3C05_02150 [Pirellulaceae bacterium]
MLVLLVATTSLPVVAETWTTLNGVSFDAEFRGMWGEAAIFQRADGKRAAIALANMRAESRLRIQALDKEVAAKRKERVDQLKQQAAIADAPEIPGMGGPLAGAGLNPAALLGGGGGTLPAVVEYEPITDGMDLETTVKHLIRQTASGHVRIFWDSLPASHQSDLDRVRSEVTSSISADQWNTRIGMLDKLTRLINEKQDMLLGLSMLQGMPAEVKDQIKSGLEPIGQFLAALNANNRLSHEVFSTTPLGTTIADVSTDVHGLLRTLFESSDSGSPVPDPDAIAVDQSSPMEGLVTVPGAPEPMKWKQVEGRWITEANADQWQDQLQTFRTEMEALFAEDTNEKVEQFTKVLDDLLAASDQQAFEAIIFRVMLQFGPQLQPMGGAAPALPSGF